MAKMRKVLAVTMAAAMTMSMLAGCGDKKTDGTEEQTVKELIRMIFIERCTILIRRAG